MGYLGLHQLLRMYLFCGSTARLIGRRGMSWDRWYFHPLPQMVMSHRRTCSVDQHGAAGSCSPHHSIGRERGRGRRRRKTFRVENIHGNSRKIIKCWTNHHDSHALVRAMHCIFFRVLLVIFIDTSDTPKRWEFWLKVPAMVHRS